MVKGYYLIMTLRKGHILKSAQNGKRHENKKSVQIRIDKRRHGLMYTSMREYHRDQQNIKKSVNSCV